jgi:hypothetical protein
MQCRHRSLLMSLSQLTPNLDNVLDKSSFLNMWYSWSFLPRAFLVPYVIECFRDMLKLPELLTLFALFCLGQLKLVTNFIFQIIDIIFLICPPSLTSEIHGHNRNPYLIYHTLW